ncbi:fumarylacetoacetate hydrolase family protein [Thalassomonas sp. M1454]|uniref:fumarylacetoacetate hydrolase family protein n=1 Tax=Thalassomonas sp. M1454 TaxID=2594477 RepID=UPI00117FC593|nr:fumarylacetoacetate hydrolase family protein [Thalassomonas sp. M1454]TRX57447.1 fumarylacetoacetate hydrolase family protein [Thalassomonas sp. M1454]
MKTVNLGKQLFTPSKVVCIGRNYVDHITELGNEIPDDMVVFNKPNSAISNQLLSFHQEQLHYEGELCFLVAAGQFIAVGFGLDLTKRGLQSKLKSKGLPWERAKAFNGAAVLTDFVAIDAIDDSLALELCINGKVVQAGGVELMMYKPQDILRELTTFIELEDGDVVMSGTPKGVGVINSGDVFSAKILQNNEVLLSHQWTAQ